MYKPVASVKNMTFDPAPFAQRRAHFLNLI